MEQLRVKLSKTKDGMLAQCLDKPEIIVTGKNKTQIKTELNKIIEGYVEAFPSTKNDFYKTNGKLLEVMFLKV